MSYDKTTLGYVFLKAWNVRDRAEAALKRISAIREENRETFLKNVMAPRPRFFGGMTKGLSREEAIEAIKDNEFAAHDWYFLTDAYESPKQASLKKMIKVAEGLMGGGDTTMQISIEAADWLFQE